MNKPKNCQCQRGVTPSVFDRVPAPYATDDLKCFGRLDQDTTGILLFGTDGGLQSLLTAPSSKIWKTYTARIVRSEGGENG
eukprot:CAMPEP_0182596748 /NCGR_PEP_ID=MMETSP1324-20130603/84830_1 /TAXON_ID=236786 /ORGANISM="Florenciella sp., Strain RCC1587" /LENGTH=80 /DNA_ID=CAMNT_0024814447 /DNA_START=25 /DNA_END=263 /DNA_ORIENTATION=+